MRGLAILAVAASVGGCNSSPGVNTANVTTEMIERVAKQHDVVEDVSATARLQPLGPVGVIGGNGARCQFMRGQTVLFFVAGDAGVARINGATRHLRAEGAIGTTGGFFREREIGVSIGVQPDGQARIVVTNRLTEARGEETGQWVCGGN